MKILGIDPGLTGGLAVVGDDDYWCLSIKGMSDRELLMAVVEAASRAGYGLLERAGPRPGEGVKSSFTFGEQYGRIKMALAATVIGYELVSPVSWQRPFSLLRTDKTESREDKKKRHVETARRMFPNVKITHDGMADAILIAEYGRRMMKPGSMSGATAIIGDVLK